MHCQQRLPGALRLGSRDPDLETLRSSGNSESRTVLRKEVFDMFAGREGGHERILIGRRTERLRSYQNDSGAVHRQLLPFTSRHDACLPGSAPSKRISHSYQPPYADVP